MDANVVSGRWGTRLVADEHLLLRAGRLRRVEPVESQCTLGEASRGGVNGEGSGVGRWGGIAAARRCVSRVGRVETGDVWVAAGCDGSVC